MTSEARITKRAALAARLQEAAERIANPEKIKAKLDHLTPTQSALMMKLYRASRARLTAQERETISAIVALFKDGTTDIAAHVALVFAEMGETSWDFSKVKRSGRYHQLLVLIDRRIAALRAHAKNALQSGLVYQFKTTSKDTAQRLDTVVKAGLKAKAREADPQPEDAAVGIDFDVLPDAAISELTAEPWAGADFSSRLGLITDDMAQNIKSQITRSMMAGEAWQQTGRRIRDEMGTTGTASVWRAEMVARTEIAHAQDLATQLFIKQNEDVIEDEVWVAHPGACPLCFGNDGQSTDEVGRPPDDSHPNCVCATMIVPKTSDEIINGVAQLDRPLL